MVGVVRVEPTCIPRAGGTSTPASVFSSHVHVQRLFSKAGDVIVKKRNSLAPAKANQVAFLMENL